MAMPKTAARLLIEQLCEKFPDTPTLQLARKAKTENPTLFTSIERARDYVRLARGNKGKKQISQATHPRKNGKAGEKLKCPPSFAEEWKPFELDAEGLVGVISDPHIPYHSEIAVEAAAGYLKKADVKTLILNGDICDFYQISRWQRDPRRRKFSDELKTVIAFLEWLRQEFPKVRIVWKDGNHEERWQHFIWNRAPEIYDLPACTIPNLLHFEDFGIEYVTDQRPIMVGKLPLLHGHELGQGIFSPVNPARGAFMKTTHTVMKSHSHQTSAHSQPNMWHDEVFTWSIGCLCELNPAWKRFNVWNWGMGLIEVYKDKSFDVQNMRISKHGEVRKS